MAVATDNNNNNNNSAKLYNNKELLKILDTLKDKSIAKLEPIFELGFGISYPFIKNYSLEEQILFCESCTKSGLFNSRPSLSVLNCSHCNSLYFCSRLSCSLCKSSNVIKGAAIEHDSCGNIDFDYNYVKSDGSLLCEKCNKKLRAIGVDYSKLGYFYKCLECKAMIANVDQQYVCLKCSRPSSQDEVKILQLSTYTIDFQKLSEKLNADNFVLSVLEELDRIGIRSKQSEVVIGKSKLKHTFTLVVYDKKNLPFVVVDVIQLEDEDNYREEGKIEQENFVLSFTARCLDAQVPNKILVAIPYLKENLRELINLNQIDLIESKNTKNAALELTQMIVDLYNKIERTNYIKINE